MEYKQKKRARMQMEGAADANDNHDHDHTGGAPKPPPPHKKRRTDAGAGAGAEKCRVSTTKGKEHSSHLVDSASDAQVIEIQPHQYSYKFLFGACYNLSQLVPAIKARKLQDGPAMSDFLKVQLIFCFASDGKRCQEHKSDKVSKFSNFRVIN